MDLKLSFGTFSLYAGLQIEAAEAIDPVARIIRLIILGGRMNNAYNIYRRVDRG